MCTTMISCKCPYQSLQYFLYASIIEYYCLDAISTHDTAYK